MGKLNDIIDGSNTIRGVVTQLFFSSATWSAGLLRLDTEDATRPRYTKFAGNCFIANLGERLVLEGKYDRNKYGLQFVVAKQCAEKGKMSVAGLASWLAVFGECHGLGPVRAEKIARNFGENFSEVLRERPEEIADVSRLSMDVIKQLQYSWFRQEDLNHVGTQLMEYGLTKHQITVMYDKFGDQTVRLLKENPYAIVGEIDGIGWKIADEIAQKMGVVKDHPGRFKAASIFAMQEAANDGSCCAQYSNLCLAIAKLLECDKNEPRLSSCVRELVAEKKLREYLIEDIDGTTGYYALPVYYGYEEKLARFLRKSRDVSSFFKPSDELVGRIESEAAWLDPSQKRAVFAALTNKAMLISGGAGAGKTTLVKEIVRICRQRGLKIQLCAPTGKAARRIESVVGYEARTIHKMLNYRPPLGFSNELLETDVVIVDETSMVDSSLAYYLVRALRPHTQLILVGDHHQLPPVGPGAILRDCIKHELLPMAILDQCHRQAGALKQSCSNILQGVVGKSNAGEDGDWPWIVLDGFDDPQTLRDKLASLFLFGIRDKLRLDPMVDTQFITPQHAGVLGTIELNKMFQALHQQELGNTVEAVEAGKKGKLMVGDKAIQTKNDYDLDVMNGHQGVVQSTEPLVIDFGDGKVVTYPKEKKGRVELGYCLSCHKTQGDQWPVIVFVCHRSHSFMLHRGLLYTAATRAMKHTVIIGDERGIGHAVRTVTINDRQTLLPFLVKEQGQLGGQEECLINL